MGGEVRAIYSEIKQRGMDMEITLITLAALATVVLLGLILLGRSGRRITTGRYGSSGSHWPLVGPFVDQLRRGKIRRLFASKERRARYERASTKSETPSW